MRVTTLVLVVGLACASSPAWAMHQVGGQRQAERSKLLGRLGEHVFLLVDHLGLAGAHYEPGSGRFRRLTRAEAAEGIWLRLTEIYEQALQAQLASYTYAKTVAEKAGRSEEFRRLQRGSGNRFATEYWRFELLIRELTPEIIATGVTQAEIDESLTFIKSLFADMEIELVIPNGAWFPDVPEDHWAEPAIHNMRRAGVLYGYPDGRFRL